MQDAKDSDSEDSQQVINMDNDPLFQVPQEFLFCDYNDPCMDLEQLSEIVAFHKIAEEFKLFNIKEEEEEEKDEEEEGEKEVQINEGA